MAVGRISGPLLKSNLIRNGVDLAFETDLLYLDVNNQRIGVNTASPQHDLDVAGTTRSQKFTVTDSATISDVVISGNTIDSNSDYLNLATLDTVVSLKKLEIDNFILENNVIKSLGTDTDIVFDPNGSAKVEIQSDLDVQGNISATGNIRADGNITIGDEDTDSVTFNAEVTSDIVPDTTDTYTLGSDPSTGGQRWLSVFADNLDVNTLDTDSVTALDTLEIDNTLTVLQDTTLGTDTSNTVTINGTVSSDIIPESTNTYNLGSETLRWQTVWARNAEIGKINFSDNQISTSIANTDLILNAGSGNSVLIEDFEFTSNKVKTTDDFIISSNTQNIEFNTSGSLVIPRGTTAQRSTSPQAGALRYNTDLDRFEGYDGFNWFQLSGVEDLDGDTKIIAETSPGSNDDTIEFIVQGNTIASIDSSGFITDKLKIDSITVQGNTVSAESGLDLQFQSSNANTVNVDDFAFKDNTITNTVPDAVTVFENTADGYVKFSGTTGLVLPYGASTERPSIDSLEVGMTRFNTTDKRIEIWNGIEWSGLVGDNAGITQNEAESTAFDTVIAFG